MSLPRYEWLSTGEVEELTTLYLNYLCLGQYELARATLMQLYTSSPGQAKEVSSTWQTSRFFSYSHSS